MITPRHPRICLAAGLLAAIVFQVLSGFMDEYYLLIIQRALIAVTLAVSLNLVNGYTGQFSLGHAGFMAMGAYASAWTTMVVPKLFPALADLGPVASQGWFFIAILVGGLTAALGGFLVGIPSLRLRGDYLAIVTLGFGEIIRVIIQSNETLGGASGMGVSLLTTPLACGVVAVLTIYVCGSLVRSTYGMGYLATRDDEIAAECSGIDTTRCKVNAFVVGAFFAGFAGALDGHLSQYINPGNYDFLKSIEIVVIVILGGMGSTIGVAIAAVGLVIAMEELRMLEQYRMIVYPLLIIGFMLLRPQGIMGSLGGKK